MWNPNDVPLALYNREKKVLLGTTFSHFACTFLELFNAMINCINRKMSILADKRSLCCSEECVLWISRLCFLKQDS